ncbi:hypothetical protein NC651_006617 [Populus alba x Populus x berolinensis]|nr:hypothetical protein NC651_006617 [Populus alba x Populus x berolinensis]
MNLMWELSSFMWSTRFFITLQQDDFYGAGSGLGKDHKGPNLFIQEMFDRIHQIVQRIRVEIGVNCD